jgi:hypothetical protein
MVSVVTARVLVIGARSMPVNELLMKYRQKKTELETAFNAYFEAHGLAMKEYEQLTSTGTSAGKYLWNDTSVLLLK